MHRLCIICGIAPATHSKRKYCQECYEEKIQGTRKVVIPEGHPWLLEREERIARMEERASRGLPIFEKSILGAR